MMGYLIGGYNDDYVAEITKVDKNGKQVNHLTIDNQFTVVAIGEHSDKYYVVVLDDNFYVSVYVFDKDLKIINSINTDYYLVGSIDVVYYSDDKIVITSLGLSNFEGIADDNSNYLLFTISYDLNNVSPIDYVYSEYNYVAWNDSVEILLKYFGKEYYYLFMNKNYTTRTKDNTSLDDLDRTGVPIDVQTNGDVTVLVGKANIYDLSGTYINFYDGYGNAINTNFIDKVSWWYTESVIADDYIYAIGTGYHQIDVYDLEGNFVESINLKDMYDTNDEDMYLSVDKIIHDNGGLTFTYTVCDMVDDCPLNCKEEIGHYGAKFKVYTKTDGNGTVEVTNQSAAGQEVTFSVTPNDGYVLGVVKVTDANGNVITFTSNTFTMPSADVTVEATFVVDNPNTKDMAIICVSLVGIIILICIILNIKKLKWLK